MPVLSPTTGKVTYSGGEALPTVGSDAYKQAQAGIIPTTPKAPVTPNPAPATLSAPIASSVVNSKAATNDLNTIQAQHTENVANIQNQAVTVANNKMQQDAQNQATEAQKSLDQQAKEKLAIDKQNADTKAAALATVNAPESPANLPLTSGGYQKTTNGLYLNPDTNTYYNSQGQSVDSDGNIAPIKSYDQTNLENNQRVLEQAQQDYQAQADKVNKAISDISAGIIPLNPGQQAQVAALQQQFQQLIQQQVLQNTNANGVANIRGYQTGAAEYDPSFQVKTIGSIVTAGLNKIADLSVREAGAVADLTEQFKDNNIKAIKEAWDVYNDASTKRQDTLQKTVASTSAAIKDARDFAYKQQQDQLAQEEQQRKDQYEMIDKPINDIAQEMAKNGAPADLINKVRNATSPGEAITLGGNYIGLLEREQQAFNQDIQKQQLSISRANLAISQAELRLRQDSMNDEGTLNGRPQNVTQAAANGYANRMNEADVIIAPLEEKFAAPEAQGGAKVLGVGLPNFVKSPDRQVFEQAKTNFALAVLRRESGAAISPTEFTTMDNAYFPQPGDAKEVLKNKAQLRNTVINNFYREANVPRPVLPGMRIQANGKTYKVGLDGQTLEEVK